MNPLLPLFGPSLVLAPLPGFLVVTLMFDGYARGSGGDDRFLWMLLVAFALQGAIQARRQDVRANSEFLLSLPLADRSGPSQLYALLMLPAVLAGAVTWAAEATGLLAWLAEMLPTSPQLVAHPRRVRLELVALPALAYWLSVAWIQCLARHATNPFAMLSVGIPLGVVLWLPPTLAERTLANGAPAAWIWAILALAAAWAIARWHRGVLARRPLESVPESHAIWTPARGGAA